MKTLILIVAVAAILATAAPTANFSGKWAIDVPGRAGQAQQRTLILNQVGTEVTGLVAMGRGSSSGSPAGTEIYDGKAEGDTISFYVWEGRDQMAKVMYKGTLSAEQITFTVTGGPPSYNPRGDRVPPRPPQQVTAKRAK
jgi:hypothetical protein